MIHVSPNSIVVYSDIGCPWAHLAVYRLHKVRAKLGLKDQIVFDHRPFALEVYNEQPTPKRTLDAEVPVVGALEPEAGWQTWQRPDFEYPVTLLPAMEAVQAAKQQSLQAGEQLDRALRVALFAQSRCISMRHEILEVAEGCEHVDRGALERALDSGETRTVVMEQTKAAQEEAVQGSPHLFLPDGDDAHNPGITKHWNGDEGVGFPVVDRDDPVVYYDLVRRAAGESV